MKWIYTIQLFLLWGLAQAADASCQSYIDLTYCLAPQGQTLAHTVQRTQGFSTLLFAEEAEMDGVKQREFAGKLREGSRVMFRNGIVLVMPNRVAEVFELQAELYAAVLDQPSSQSLVICTLMKTGDECKGEVGFKPWSVGVRIQRNQGSPLGYAISFHSRNTDPNPRYTLPSTPLKEGQTPGIWIVLSQQALARFYKEPEDWGNCDPGFQVCA